MRPVLLSRLRPRAPGLRLPRPGPRVLGLALLAVSLLGGLFLALRDSSVVGIAEVRVEGATGPQAHALRRALDEAARDMTTLHVRMDDLRYAARAHPIVDDLRVDREFPDALTITVVERAPAAALTVGEHAVAVAGDGTLLPGHPTGGLATVRAQNLPMGGRLRTGSARTAVAVLAAMPGPLRDRAARAARGERGWTVQLREGPVVHLGTADRLAAKWAAASAVLGDPASRGAVYVDVRLPERPTAGGLAPLPSPADGVVPPAEGIEEEAVAPAVADPSAPVE
ncbi:MAG TPA: FtsQ-type POTRA domain-containing protein [Solirubrobacteraceae bacterium]|nr:FtsQ-type POTRA domain-containing protein [Solirubrobacteraceae bacterium]